MMATMMMMEKALMTVDDSISIENSVESVLNDLKQTLDEEDARLKHENNVLFSLNDSLTTSEETQSSSISEISNNTNNNINNNDNNSCSNIIILKANSTNDLETLNVEANCNYNTNRKSSSNISIGNQEENTESIEDFEKPDEFLLDDSNALMNNEENTRIQTIETSSEIMNSHELNYFNGTRRQAARNSNNSNLSNKEKRFSKDSSSSNEFNTLEPASYSASMNKSFNLSVTDTSTYPNKSNAEADVASFASANNSFNLDDFQQPKYNSKKSSPSHNKSESKSKKPWYSAFTNTYKQKNCDFKKLFKLNPDEHLLVDYSCALQREILAHGRLYISLNYVCFRANIIGWETTLVIKLKEIRQINKDKTAKIIPNAITIVTDSEKYFFTSFAARDKTYTTLFRVWQITLADGSMSPEEINNILKSSYGEDLGYNSDDADFEYYSKLKSKETASITPEAKFYKNSNTSSAVEFNTSETNLNAGLKNLSTISSSESSSSSPVIPKNSSYLSTSYNYNNNNNTNNNNETVSKSLHGHRQSSSYDTSLIDTSNNERPRSMVVNNQQSASMLPKNQSSFVQITNNPSNSNDIQLVSSTEITSNGFSTKEKNSESFPDNENNNRENDNANFLTLTNNHSIGAENFSTLKPTALSEVQLNPSSSSPFLSTSSPIHNIPSSDPSSSSESENNEDLSEMLYTTKCSCNEHNGKEMLNQIFNLNVNYLWESLFGHTEFCRKYWESRKFFNFKITEWKPVNTFVMRQLEYTVDLGAIGRPKNTEDQKIIEYKPNVCIVLESESATHGVPYSDCFTVRNRFCITRVTSNSTRLCVTSFLNYVQKPNFIAKGFIERNTMNALKDSYNYLANLIEKEYVNCSPKLCHEYISATQIASCLLTISISTTSDESKNKINKDNNNNSNRNNNNNNKSSVAVAPDVTAAANVSLSFMNNELDREKHLPKVVQPQTIPIHISAVTNSTSDSLLSKNSSKAISGQIANQFKNSNLNENNENVINNSNTNIINRTVSNSSASKYISGNSIKKRHLRNSQAVNEYQIVNEIHNESLHVTTNSAQKLQPQLVPIQKFSFFKWEINVDTLVRLFIIAMTCLMIINAMLYFKLRRIETLADGLRNDPNILAKISNQQLVQKQYENKMNENALLNDLHGWRDVISNTLNVIEKMETSLKEWDKSLERRQTETDLNSVTNDLKGTKEDL